LNLELTFENIRGDRMGMGQKFAKSLPATQFTTYADYRADFGEFLSEFLLPAVRAHTGMRKFSKVCFIVIVYSKLSSELTFEKVHPAASGTGILKNVGILKSLLYSHCIQKIKC